MNMFTKNTPIIRSMLKLHPKCSSLGAVQKRSVTRLLHTNFQYGLGSQEFDIVNAAANLGYRVVSPCDAARYTSTEPMLTASTTMSFDHNNESHSISGSTVNTLGDIFEAVAIDTPEEVMATQAEWDCLMEEETSTKPHFELLKEDPYLSEYEEVQKDWQRFTRAGGTNPPMSVEEDGEATMDYYDQGYELDY